MSIPMEVLAAEVLALSPDERSQLLDRLLASFDSEPLDLSWESEWADEVDRREWADEVDRREAAISSGKSAWLAGDAEVARLRARSA